MKNVVLPVAKYDVCQLHKDAASGKSSKNSLKSLAKRTGKHVLKKLLLDAADEKCFVLKRGK